jgi:hypothetical protein
MKANQQLLAQVYHTECVVYRLDSLGVVKGVSRRCGQAYAMKTILWVLWVYVNCN